VLITFPITLAAAPVAAEAAPAATAGAAARRLLAAQTTEWDLTCLRFAGTVFTTEAADGAFAATDSGNGTATCATTRGGTYLIAATPRAAAPDYEALQAGEIAYTAPASTKPYSFIMRFIGMDFGAIMSDATMRADFRDDLVAAVAQGIKVDAANVQLSALSNGSVIATVTLHAPDSWSAAQVKAAADAILSNPKGLFSEDFLTRYGISDVEASLESGTELPGAAKGGLSAGAQAGIAIAVIVAVLGGAGGGFLWWRKRQAARGAGQQPVFDNLAGAEGGAGGYVPPPAGGARG
jgi:hypothetical protein